MSDLRLVGNPVDCRLSRAVARMMSNLCTDEKIPIGFKKK